MVLCSERGPEEIEGFVFYRRTEDVDDGSLDYFWADVLENKKKHSKVRCVDTCPPQPTKEDALKWFWEMIKRDSDKCKERKTNTCNPVPTPTPTTQHTNKGGQA
jgi:hypothetical protein